MSTLDPAGTGLARRVWQNQIEQAGDALKPWVRTTPDGFTYIDPDAPADLVAAYRSLLITGYSFPGWMP